MIITHLSIEGRLNLALSFHPRVTVVSGLGPEKRAVVAEMIVAALRGDPTGVHIEAEVDGQMLELTPETVADLELDQYSPDVRIRARDLPGAIVLNDNSTPSATVQPDNDPFERNDDPEQERFVDDLEAARYGLGQIPLRFVEGPLRDLWTDLGQTWERRNAAQAEVDRLRETPSDPGHDDVLRAEAVLSTAREEFMAARSRLEQAEGPAERMAELNRRHRELLEQRQDLYDRLPADPPPTDAVVSALSALDLAVAESLRDRPLPEAQELADRWVSVLRQIEERPKPTPPRWLVAEAESALESARQRLEQAERDQMAAAVSPEEIAALEEAHSRVVEAESKGSRFFGGSNKKKVEELRQAEQEALAKLGVSSYDTFLLNRLAFGAGRDSAEIAMQEARAALIDAEAVWDELHRPQDDPVMDHLIAEREEIRTEAYRLLGNQLPDEKLEVSLRGLQMPPVSLTPAIDRLWDALDAQGVHAEPDDDVRKVARRWLAGILDNEELRQSIRLDLADVGRQLEAVEAEISEIRANLEELQDPSDAEERMRALQQSVEQAEERVAEADRLVFQAQERARELAIPPELVEEADRIVRGLTESFEALRDKLLNEIELAYQREEDQQIAAQAAAIARRWDSVEFVEDEVDVSGVPTDAVEVYTLSRVAAQRLVGNAGTLPFVVQDAYRGLNAEAQETLRGLLVRISGIVQVIYLTDDDEVVRWIEGQPADVGESFHVAGAYEEFYGDSAGDEGFGEISGSEPSDESPGETGYIARYADPSDRSERPE